MERLYILGQSERSSQGIGAAISVNSNVSGLTTRLRVQHSSKRKSVTGEITEAKGFDDYRVSCVVNVY